MVDGDGEWRATDDALDCVDIRSDPQLAALARRWSYEEWARHVCSEPEHRLWFETMLIRTIPDPYPICLVARRNGAPAGAASVLPDDGLPAPYNKASGLTPWIAMVYTAPEHRGRGVATFLVRRLTAMLENAGVDVVHLFTPDQQRLYERLGFEAFAASTTPETNEAVTVMRRRLGG